MVAVAPDANPLDDPADAAALREHAARLVAVIDASVGSWIERLVLARWTDWRADDPPGAVAAAARAAGERARSEVTPALRELLVTDVDEQRSNPLTLLRAASGHATRVLREEGVPPVARDEQAEALFPDDVYDLVPGSFADVDPSLEEPGLVWGAAKAHVVLARRRREGLR